MFRYNAPPQTTLLLGSYKDNKIKFNQFYSLHLIPLKVKQECLINERNNFTQAVEGRFHG